MAAAGCPENASTMPMAVIGAEDGAAHVLVSYAASSRARFCTSFQEVLKKLHKRTPSDAVASHQQTQLATDKSPPSAGYNRALDLPSFTLGTSFLM